MIETPKKVRILLASSIHCWNDVRIYHKEAHSLTAQYDVTVMGVASDADLHMGEVNVLVLPRPRSLLHRFLNSCKILTEGATGDYAIFHFHDPELLWVGFVLKLLRKRVIYDVHENTYDAIQIRTWLPKHLRNLLGKLTHGLELIGQWGFNGVILAEDSYVRNFSKNENVAVVRNYVRIESEPLALSHGTKRILYVGAVTVARGLGDFLEALAILQPADGTISATVVGQSAPNDAERLLELRSNLPNSENVDLLPHVDFSELRTLAERCELAVVPLRDVLNYQYSIPTKILDYMNWGIPYVYSRLSLSYKLFAESSGGVSYEPGNVADLSEKIRYLLSDEKILAAKAKEGRDKVSSFDWGKEEEELFKLYERITGE